MELKEIREKCKLTQKQAAQLTGIPLRTYARYENDPSKVDSIKYNHALIILSDNCRIDEEHGILELEEIKYLVGKVCEINNVEFCILFGSYAKGTQTEKSDLDLLVNTNLKGLAFYGLVEDFRQALKKKVDVIRIDDLVQNTELLSEILKDGIRVYPKK